MVDFEYIPGATIMTVYFDAKEWTEQLSVLHHREVISVIGTIYSIRRSGVALDQCRILSVGV
jgi:hypothetical protein